MAKGALTRETGSTGRVLADQIPRRDLIAIFPTSGGT